MNESNFAWQKSQNCTAKEIIGTIVDNAQCRPNEKMLDPFYRRHNAAELASATLVQEVGKPPDVSETDSETNASEDEFELPTPRSTLHSSISGL